MYALERGAQVLVCCTYQNNPVQIIGIASRAYMYALERGAQVLVCCTYQNKPGNV